MTSTGQFVGLSMPVFTAFGWAGEETAIKFALTQLESFISSLHGSLSREAQTLLPFWGIDKEMQLVYLAANRDAEQGPYIAFHARPLAFEMQLVIKDKAAVNRGLRAAEKEPVAWHRYISQLGEDWTYRIQQSQVDEDSGAVSHYQDIFKNTANLLTPEESTKVVSRAAFLNSEAKWLTPVYISRKLPSEAASAMKGKLSEHMAAEIDSLLNVLSVFTRQARKGEAKKTKTTRRKSSKATTDTKKSSDASKKVVNEESFVYVTELKPLHLRKGFINLTPAHWPFFAINARTESRPISLYLDGPFDETSSVWRLQPTEMARIVLSEKAHEWMEGKFTSGSKIEVKATRLPDKGIQIILQEAE